MATYMTDFLTLELLADHVRKCLVLTEDPVAVRILLRATAELNEHAQRLREEFRHGLKQEGEKDP